MDDKIEIKWLTGTKHLAPLEYFTRDVASLSAAMRFGLHAAEIGTVGQDDTLPAGVLECRVGGKSISRLWFE